MTRDILLSLIDADPAQARTLFAADALAELSASLTEHGQLSPVLVRPTGERFTLIHGERRCRAALSIGWAAIRAEIRDVTPEEAPWLALAENLHRADLSPLEEAHAYAARIAAGTTQTEIARKLGRSQSAIAHKLRLLKHPAEVQTALVEGTLTEGHARQILRLDTPERQVLTAQAAVAEGWSVATLSGFIDKGGAMTRVEAQAQEAEILSTAEALELQVHEEAIRRGLSELEASMLACAENARIIASVLKPADLAAWGAAHSFTPPDLAALLSYHGGPLSDAMFDCMMHRFGVSL